jgi:hypothetical protein
MKKITTVLAGMGLLLLGGIAAADMPEGCTFTWNVTHELALFGAAAGSATAGRDAASAPTLEADKLYELALTPQSEVSFAHPPSKRALSDGAFAGMAKVHITTPGVYRVAIDGAFWIDVLADGKLLTSGDFTGAHGCKTLRKLVEFPMPAGDVLVQLSGAGVAHVHMAMTPSPKAKSAP